MRVAILIFLSALFVDATSVSAETKFISYNNYLIPISAGNHCSEIPNNGKTNVFYIDDISSYPKTAEKKFYGGDDPNGFSDLAIVVGFNDKVNLLGVGTSNGDSESFDLAQRLVSKTGENVPVNSQDQITERIKFFARCLSNTNKLVVAIGGPWNKVSMAIDESIAEQDSIVGRVRVIGIGGFNIENNYDYYDGNPQEAYLNIVNKLGSDVKAWYDEGSNHGFRKPYQTEPGYSNSDLSLWWDTHFKRVLSGIKDSSGKDVTRSDHPYVIEVVRNTGSKLKIADFLTVADVIWPDSEVNSKEFIHPKIEMALARLRR